MNVLDNIIAHKRKEVARRRVEVPIDALARMSFFERHIRSLKRSILSKKEGGFITEFKRRSPSRGVINDRVSLTDTVKGYKLAGAAGISVLTDTHFFGGTNEDLIKAKEAVGVPLLRKDFIVDEYQIIEAKAIGADAILLIAAALSATAVRMLSSVARAMDMEVLLELHEEAELDHICDNISIVGVNNRNLKDFSVNLDRSYRLLEQIPDSFARISESGISQPEDAAALRQAGFDGFLIGAGFMEYPDPALAFADFLKKYTALVCY